MRPPKLLNQHDASGSLPSIVDEENRTIYLFGPIDDASALGFVSNFRTLDKGSGLITIIINSVGGEDAAGLAIYDTMLLSKNHVVIEGYGTVDSIAALIFQAADHRLLSPQCRMLIHDGHMTFDSSDVGLQMLNSISVEAMTKRLVQAQIIAKRTKRKVKEILDIMAKETYFSAEEAIKFGLADSVIGS